MLCCGRESRQRKKCVEALVHILERDKDEGITQATRMSLPLPSALSPHPFRASIPQPHSFVPFPLLFSLCFFFSSFFPSFFFCFFSPGRLLALCATRRELALLVPLGGELGVANRRWQLRISAGK